MIIIISVIALHIRTGDFTLRSIRMLRLNYKIDTSEFGVVEFKLVGKSMFQHPVNPDYLIIIIYRTTAYRRYYYLWIVGTKMSITLYSVKPSHLEMKSLKTFNWKIFFLLKCLTFDFFMYYSKHNWFLRLNG